MKNTILFVDDDINIIKSLERNLRKEFVILTALSGEEGLNLLYNNNDIAVVISDYKMPIMNGIEFLNRVEKINPNIKRILLSGSLPELDMDSKNSYFETLSKPWDYAILINTLNKAIESYND